MRSQFALDVVPTKSYAANSAWQQLNVLAHNLCRSFQLDTIAETKGISRKRTCTHLLNTIRTIRFRIINKAGRLVRVSGRNAGRISSGLASLLALAKWLSNRLPLLDCGATSVSQIAVSTASS